MALVSAQTPASGATEPLSGLFSLRDVFVQGFYNIRIVLACVLAGLALGIVGALLSPPQFTADSSLLVLPDPTDVLVPQGPSGPAANDQILRIVQSDVQILQSDPVIEAAIRRIGPEKLADLGGLPFLHHHGARPMADTAERFKKALRVSAEPTSNVVHVSFTASDRNLSAQALEALIAAFGDRRAAMFLDPAYGPQGEELRRYAAQLRGIDGQIQQLGAKNGVIDIAQDTQLANNRLDNLNQRLSQAKERLSAADAELSATSQGVAATPARVFQSQDSTNAIANDDARNTLLRLRQDRAHLAAQYTDKWPGLKEDDAKIAAAEAQMTQNGRDRYLTDRTQRNPVLDQLDSRLSNLKIERQSLAEQIAELGRQIGQAQGRIGQLRDVSGQIHDLQRQRDVTDGIYRQLSVTQAGAALRDQAQGLRDSGFRVIEPPAPPAKPHSLRLTFLIGGLLLGIVLAVVVSGLAMLGRQVFITPGEASRSLRIPNLAHFDARESHFRSPEGRAAVGRFATLLVDTAVDGRLLKVIQIAATEAEDKSDFALELARAIAAEQSQRTLLVDFDSEARYAKMIDKSPAVRTLPASSATLTVARTSTPKLWLALDAGASPFGDPRLPLTEVQASLEAIQPHFDRILIVARKDFSQYAARRLYALADANVLVVRAEKTRAPAARQLKETVLAAGGDILGFVFTFRGYYIPEKLYRWL